MHRARSLAVAVIASAASLPAYAQFWNAAAEFDITSNPNGVWGYGWLDASLQGPFQPFQQSVLYEGQLPMWFDDHRPHTWRNDRPGTAFGVAPGQLSMHPAANFDAAVVRWVNPDPTETGTLSVTAAFFPGDRGVMRVGVRINEVLRFEALDSGLFTLELPNSDVQTIDFMVWGGYAFGNTPVEATVRVTTDRCIGDFNRDGGVDGSDVADFFETWEAGDLEADLDLSGGVDGADVELFFARWEAGC
ncbi:MAG: hypothetical protein RL689_2126 [Planctomycetota bacterium]|jgi:hypothetical protein